VTTFGGGNPDLQPETAKTLTAGASLSPSFIQGLNFSVDYYSIKISQAISALNAANLTRACAAGNTAACDRVVRDPVTQTITTAFSNQQNVARFEQSGMDFEASYLLPLSRVSTGMGGTLRIRALATHIRKSIFDTGVTRTDDVGNANSIPKWRGLLSFTYQDEVVGLDARLRYVHSGLFDKFNPNLVNNRIDSRIYTDLGFQLKVDGRFTFFGSINNIFDVDPPILTGGSTQFDVVGTYFTAGARVKF
jgi:outer membrane receptor protein involved in Fe transport